MAEIKREISSTLQPIDTGDTVIIPIRRSDGAVVMGRFRELSLAARIYGDQFAILPHSPERQARLESRVIRKQPVWSNTLPQEGWTIPTPGLRDKLWLL